MVSILAQTKMHCAKYFPKRHKNVFKGLKCLGHNRRMFMPRHGRTLRCSYRAVGLTGGCSRGGSPLYNNCSNALVCFLCFVHFAWVQLFLYAFVQYLFQFCHCIETPLCCMQPAATCSGNKERCSSAVRNGNSNDPPTSNWVITVRAPPHRACRGYRAQVLITVRAYNLALR